MQWIHLPSSGPRYWVALCVASIFGANVGDFFARNLGLGHVAGLPFLAAALAIVMIAERFDRITHQVYYWIAIIVVRTAATNFADFACGDLKLPRLAVMAGLAVMLALAVGISWQIVWRNSGDKTEQTLPVLRADLGYWICMFIAGTLGRSVIIALTICISMMAVQLCCSVQSWPRCFSADVMACCSGCHSTGRSWSLFALLALRSAIFMSGRHWPHPVGVTSTLEPGAAIKSP